MKMYEGMDVQIIFLTLAIVGGKESPSCPGGFTPREKDPSINSIGGWVGGRISMEKV
jgi:hypothetical protein